MTIEEHVCELNKMKTSIERLEEASQYFTCRGHVVVSKKIDEAIRNAEAVANAYGYWMLREEAELQKAYTTIK
tara:strand:+ start:601 stop:819 length:219 start_codon:yes stop_codon:yes gene_type:complete